LPNIRIPNIGMTLSLSFRRKHQREADVKCDRRIVKEGDTEALTVLRITCLSVKW
jgi:hypothetical protein